MVEDDPFTCIYVPVGCSKREHRHLFDNLKPSQFHDNFSLFISLREGIRCFINSSCMMYQLISMYVSVICNM